MDSYGLDESTSDFLQRSLPASTFSSAVFSEGHNLSTENTNFLDGYEEISDTSTLDVSLMGGNDMGARLDDTVIQEYLLPEDDNQTIKGDDDQTIKDGDISSIEDDLTVMNDEASDRVIEPALKFPKKNNLNILGFDKKKIFCDDMTWKEIENIPIPLGCGDTQEEYIDEEFYPEQIQPPKVRSIVKFAQSKRPTTVVVKDDEVTKVFIQ
uniref:Uncharacterized protein n=1 Tax=Panagrolaimus superbus TaxID=310955 RepID=A0A914XUM1_9BILA